MIRPGEDVRVCSTCELGWSHTGGPVTFYFRPSIHVSYGSTHVSAQREISEAGTDDPRSVVRFPMILKAPSSARSSVNDALILGETQRTEGSSEHTVITSDSHGCPSCSPKAPGAKVHLIFIK